MKTGLMIIGGIILVMASVVFVNTVNNFVDSVDYTQVFQADDQASANKVETIKKTIKLFVLFVVIGILIVLVLRIIKENQMGIRVTLGKPGNRMRSGPRLALWPVQKIVKYPTTQQSIQFAVPTIMTKRGRVAGYSETIEPAEITILFTLYYNFDWEKLLDTIVKAPGASEKAMASELIPYVTDVIRTIVGRIPWRLINEERYKFSQLVLSRVFPIAEAEKTWKLDHKEYEKEKGVNTFSFVECLDSPIDEEDLFKSPFIMFGLKNISLAVENINFTDADLQKAISAPERARLEASAKKLVAAGERKKREEEGKGDAEARKAMIMVIKKEKDLEVLQALKEIAQGTSNTILYQLPRVLESKVSDLLGDNSPGEITKVMSNKNKKWIHDLIEKSINELKKTSGGK